VLALQGAFIEHEAILAGLGAEAVEVRLPEQLQGLQGLIIPGGESTTIGKLAVSYNFVAELRRLALEGLPMWGICAGMIVLAKRLVGGIPQQPLLEVMDILVRRNAFGRQVDSFEVELDMPALGAVSTPEEKGKAFPGVFIRAPYIEVVGKGVEVLARLPEGGAIVAARQGSLLASAFHPELTADTRFHRYFLSIVAKRGSS